LAPGAATAAPGASLLTLVTRSGLPLAPSFLIGLGLLVAAAFVVGARRRRDR